MQQVVGITVCKVKLGKLSDSVHLHLEESSVSDSVFNAVPQSEEFAVDLDEVERNRDQSRNDHQVGNLYDQSVVLQIVVALVEREQEVDASSVEELRNQYLYYQRDQILRLRLMPFPVS